MDVNLGVWFVADSIYRRPRQGGMRIANILPLSQGHASLLLIRPVSEHFYRPPDEKVLSFPIIDTQPDLRYFLLG